MFLLSCRRCADRKARARLWSALNAEDIDTLDRFTREEMSQGDVSSAAELRENVGKLALENAQTSVSMEWQHRSLQLANRTCTSLLISDGSKPDVSLRLLRCLRACVLVSAPQMEVGRFNELARHVLFGIIISF